MASQKRGGAIITWGPISRRSSRIVSGSSGKLTVAPTWSAMAEHRGLRGARGPRGVREQGHIRRASALEQLLVEPPFARVELAPVRRHGLQADEDRVLVRFQPAHVVHDDPLEP